MTCVLWLIGLLTAVAGRLTEIGIKTSRTVSMLKNVELADSMANVLPYGRFREVCEILGNIKEEDGSHCEGSIGKVFVKATYFWKIEFKDTTAKNAAVAYSISKDKKKEK